MGTTWFGYLHKPVALRPTYGSYITFTLSSQLLAQKIEEGDEMGGGGERKRDIKGVGGVGWVG